MKNTDNILQVTYDVEILADGKTLVWGTTDCMQLLHAYSAVVASTIKHLIDSIFYVVLGLRPSLVMEIQFDLHSDSKKECDRTQKDNASITYIFERTIGDIDTFPTVTEGLDGASKEVVVERCDLIAGEVFNKGVIADHVVDKIKLLSIPDTLSSVYDINETKEEDEVAKAQREKDESYLDFYLRALVDFVNYVLVSIYGSEHEIKISALYVEPDFETTNSYGWEIHAALLGVSPVYREEVIGKLRNSVLLNYLPEVVLYENEKEYKSVIARVNN